MHAAVDHRSAVFHPAHPQWGLNALAILIHVPLAVHVPVVNKAKQAYFADGPFRYGHQTDALLTVYEGVIADERVSERGGFGEDGRVEVLAAK